MDKIQGRRILFVVNPISGGTDKSGLEEFIDDFTGKQYLVYRVFYTTETETLENLKIEIRNFDPEIVMAVGGDGTCNLVANAVIGSDLVMGIIPFGSANGLATELGISKALETSMQLLVNGKIKTIDTLRVNGRLCLHISDIGLNARVIKRFEKEKIRGIYGYARQFFKELWGAHPSVYTFITENGKQIRRRAHIVAIANASKYGTGALINPNGKIDDGEFELVIVKPYTFLGFFSLASAIFLGYLDRIKYVEIESCKWIKIINNKLQPLHIDGEIVEDSTVIVAAVDPASLKMIVPVESEEALFIKSG